MKPAAATSERQQHQLAVIASMAKKYMCVSTSTRLDSALARNSAAKPAAIRPVHRRVFSPVRSLRHRRVQTAVPMRPVARMACE